MRTITAPGIELNEIDKSQYSKSMVGTHCYIMGVTDKGESYTPTEFTSRTAWTSYYGIPTTEAERYSYAAVCEVLNNKGNVIFSKLPYYNDANDKIVGFKYNIASTTSPVSNDFSEIVSADNTVLKSIHITPATSLKTMVASEISKYISNDKKVSNGTFEIYDKTYGTYEKIAEDSRKGISRDLVGIMPVITTAANAMYAQNYLNVENQNACKYENIGKITTLCGNVVLDKDLSRLLDTEGYYTNIYVLNIRIDDSVSSSSQLSTPSELILDRINNSSTYKSLTYNGLSDTWDGSYQTKIIESTTGSNSMSVFTFSYQQPYVESELSNQSDKYEIYKKQYGYHNASGNDQLPNTVSFDANCYFPIVGFEDGKFDRTNLKKIGIVVYKMYIDSTEGNKISFEAVESFAGSLNRKDKDKSTGASIFIDDIVNNNSKYIYFFSNCFNTPASKTQYSEADIFTFHGVQFLIDANIQIINDFRTLIEKIKTVTGWSDVPTVIDCDDIQENIALIEEKLRDANDKSLDDTFNILRTRLYACVDDINSLSEDRLIKVASSLGFTSNMTDKKLSLSNTILNGISKCFEIVKNRNDYEIDIIPDAGLANIASYLAAIYDDGVGEYDIDITDDSGNSLLSFWKADTNGIVSQVWKQVQNKYNDFCKKTRKDCMFISDGPRPLSLACQQKIVKQANSDATIDLNIIPNLKYFTGLNTSYGAGYVPWFQQADDYTGDMFWCPPSIKAMGIYINTDVNYNYFDAPAGLTRGIVNASDVSFSPTIDQAGQIYDKCWNYAINYPNDGIVLEGQKTFQVKESAFDRVNVRRLSLRLEKQTFEISKYFLYEGNTSYNRQRLLDAIDPYFKSAKANGGIYDYKLKCDDENNTDEVIDNNELYLSIGIKPTKTIEWIIINFIATSTGGSWEEVGL